MGTAYEDDAAQQEEGGMFHSTVSIPEKAATLVRGGLRIARHRRVFQSVAVSYGVGLNHGAPLGFVQPISR